MDNRDFLRGQRKGQAFVVLAVTAVWLYVLYLFAYVSQEVLFIVKSEHIPFTWLNSLYFFLFFVTPFTIPVSICLMWLYYFKGRVWDALLWGAVPLAVFMVAFATLYTLFSIA